WRFEDAAPERPAGRRAARRRGTVDRAARDHGSARARRRAKGRGDGAPTRPDEGRCDVSKTPSCYVVLCYVFMGGVVAGACETGIKPTATIAAPDSADQVLFGMSHYVTDAGIQRAH